MEQFSKNENGKWWYESYQGEDAIIKLQAVALEIAVRDLYQRVQLSDRSSISTS